MDEQEARELLGIAPDAPPRGWARAYLKAVRATRIGERSLSSPQFHEAYEALLRAEATRSGTVTANADGFDRFTLHGPGTKALAVLRRTARGIGVLDRTGEGGSEFLLLVTGASAPVEVRATAGMESTSVRVVVPPATDPARLLASDVVLRLVLGVNERARRPPADPDDADVTEADETEGDEIAVGVYVETDDEDVFRDVAKHVEEIAAFLGDGRSIRVG